MQWVKFIVRSLLRFSSFLKKKFKAYQKPFIEVYCSLFKTFSQAGRMLNLVKAFVIEDIQSEFELLILL